MAQLWADELSVSEELKTPPADPSVGTCTGDSSVLRYQERATPIPHLA